MMSVVAIGLISLGGALLVGVCVLALLKRPKQPVAPENDTVAFVLEGPPDGMLVRVEGRVRVPRPVYAPSGTPCAMVELYGSDSDAPARALQRRVAPFLVEDGTQSVAIDPAVELIAFDLPTAELEGQDGVMIERRLEPGARVQVVGCIRRTGAPGHEEIALVPAEGTLAVTLTYLQPPTGKRAYSSVVVDDRV
jgi:hypothetical protein